MLFVVSNYVLNITILLSVNIKPIAMPPSKSRPGSRFSNERSRPGVSGGDKGTGTGPIGLGETEI